MKKFASVNMRWKNKESYWLTQPIIAHGSGSAGCWKTRAREENSRPRSRTTAFTLADYRAIQQTRPRIAQCKPSYTITVDWGYNQNFCKFWSLHEHKNTILFLHADYREFLIWIMSLQRKSLRNILSKRWFISVYFSVTQLLRI